MRYAVIAWLFLTSPHAHATDMVREVETRPIAVDPDQATVVFIRPKGAAFAVKPAILDHTGRVLGEVWTKSYVVARMSPGEYAFTGWGEGTPTLYGNLEAGEVYYVFVKLSAGAWVARPQLFAMGPEREHWDDLPAWLARCRRLEIDPGGLQAFESERGPDIENVLDKGRRAWDGYDTEKRKERALMPDDGITEPISP